MCYWINPNALVIAEIDWNKIPKILQSYIGKKYEDAFPVLSSLEDDSSILMVTDLVSKIQTELERRHIKLDKSVLILGVPLKDNVLFAGSPVLLVVLQIYFLVHYRQLLNSNRQRNAKLPSTPWIGVYDDLLARLIMILTLFLMPPLAILLLWLHVGYYFILCVAGISTTISLWQARLIWSSWF